MSKNYEFYPMITRTVKTLIGIVSKNEEKKFLLILQNYPNIQVVDTPLLLALVQELDRQYTRWNKEGDNGK